MVYILKMLLILYRAKIHHVTIYLIKIFSVVHLRYIGQILLKFKVDSVSGKHLPKRACKRRKGDGESKMLMVKIIIKNLL